MALRPRDEQRAPRLAPPRVAPAPGGVAAVLLRPHAHLGADGLRGGTPHLHALAAETYVAVSGRGRLQVIDAEGPAVHTLEPGAQVTCGAGTISRVIDDGDLLIVLVVEAVGVGTPPGDVVVPGASDPAAPGAHGDAVATLLELIEALEDRTVEGYLSLHRSVPARLDASLDAFGAAIDDGDAAGRARRNLAGLRSDDVHHLVDAVAAPASTLDRLPCCAALVGVPVVPDPPG